MSQTEDKMINELVTELLDEVKTENKEPVEETQTQPNSVDSEKKESQETNPFASTMGNGMPKIDLSQANKLFSGLIKSFIPPELKKNKDVQKMFDMFFKDDKPKKEDAQEKLEKNQVVNDIEDEDHEEDSQENDVEDEDVQENNEEDTDDVDEDEDTEDIDEDESQDNVKENEEESQDEDCDCDNCEYESVKYAFVIMRDDKPIAYTKKFTNAQKYMNKLYRNLLIKYANVFTKTVRELGSIRVYERKVYTLFPFQDTLMAHFSIKQVPNVA